MKKFASFMLILALSAFSVGAITGCGGDKDKDKDKDAAKDAKDKDTAK